MATFLFRFRATKRQLSAYVGNLLFESYHHKVNFSRSSAWTDWTV